jgi:hypothetical protein
MRTGAFVVVALVSLLGADLTGTWSAQIPDLDGAKKDFSFVFQTTSESVSGWVRAGGDEWPILEGSLMGTKLRFTIKVAYGGAERDVHFFGVISDDVIEFVRQWTEKTGRGAQIRQIEFNARRPK